MCYFFLLSTHQGFRMFLLNVERTFEIEIVLVAKAIAPNEAKAISFAQT